MNKQDKNKSKIEEAKKDIQKRERKDRVITETAVYDTIQPPRERNNDNGSSSGNKR